MYWAAEHDNVFNERWNTDWPAWETAGKHLRFAPPLERQASEYLKYIMDGDRPFIAIRTFFLRSARLLVRADLTCCRFLCPLDARHGDFGCPESATPDPSRPPSSSSCFRSPSSYIPTVSHLITALSELKDVSVSPRDVILFSDEEDEAWWAEVSELGWKRVDHRLLGTKERWDNWYPTLIDMVLMSKAKGFSEYHHFFCSFLTSSSAWKMLIVTGSLLFFVSCSWDAGVDVLASCRPPSARLEQRHDRPRSSLK